MEQGEHQERWPVIGQSDVADFCREICASIAALERAFEAGELSNELTSGPIEKILGPQLFEAYGRLVGSAPGPLHHLRVDAVSALLARLQNDLAPTKIAHAQVHVATERDPQAAEQETESRRRSPFKFVEARFDGGAGTPIRFDQMLDARFWRIGFTFETPDLGDAFAQEIVRSATSRLASDLLGLQRILESFRPETLKQELRIVPDPRDRRFEHLILDILNEHRRHATAARLVEDFLEKTDLRVKYPGLNRKRGGRVQVTSIIAPELHKTKIQAIRLAEEFVFLSPLSLAEFANSLRSHAPAGPGSETPSFSLSALWDCLEAKPIDVPQLASELKRIMFRALTELPDSPLGPMMQVPLPVRQLVRLFVEARAIASTDRLREREKGDPNWGALVQGRRRLRRQLSPGDLAPGDLAPAGSNVDDSDDRNERRSEFLRALSVGDKVRGRIRNVVDYGAFIDLGCIDGLLHLRGIPGAVNGAIGEKLAKGDEIEVEVLEIDIEKQRISLRMPVDDADGEM